MQDCTSVTTVNWTEGGQDLMQRNLHMIPGQPRKNNVTYLPVTD